MIGTEKNKGEYGKMEYRKHEMDIMMFEETDAIVFTMTDGGHEVNPWSINPDRSDA